jgi:diacylglycerol kinase (ATP)
MPCSAFAEAGCTDLFISSGDGTVQAIQTLLAEKRIFPTLPRICLLPHGTTNMTAADIGYTDKEHRGAGGFHWRPGATGGAREANPCGPPIRVTVRHGHGMFLGTGAVSAATRHTQVSLNDKGVKGNAATFAALASAVGKSLFSAPNPHDPNRFDRPFPITVKEGNTVLATGTQLLALATTLDKLILGTRPFWGGKSGPIRVTTFPYPVPNIPRWFLPAIMGGENRTAPPGATSHAVSVCSIETPAEFVIDGEFFDAPEGAALRIESGPEFTYIIR